MTAAAEPSVDGSLPATLDAWLRWLETRQPAHVIRPGLERVGRVGRRLGLVDADGNSPIGRTFTVGGTNGKGSATTLLADTLAALGSKTGRFQSPHLLHYRERVWLDGRFATDDELCAAFGAVERARGATDLTYFEVNLLAALWVFRAAGCTAQVLEVGLGGRLDAVNIVSADAALVTSIGLDHEDWLGAGREAIAREKAGIFRAGRPAVIAEPGAPTVLDAEAARVGATGRRAGRDYVFAVEDDGATWAWRGRGARGEAVALDRLPLPGLAGAVQVQNAAGVLAVLLASGLPSDAVASAFRWTLPRLRAPGRYDRRPAVPGHRPEVILDVAHNAEAAAALAATLLADRSPAGTKGHPRTALLLAMLADKPAEAVAARLAPAIDGPVFVAGLGGPRGQSAGRLAERVAGAFSTQEIVPVESVVEALDVASARLRNEAGARLVVCGSFHTLAETMTALKLPLLP